MSEMLTRLFKVSGPSEGRIVTVLDALPNDKLRVPCSHGDASLVRVNTVA